MKFLIVALALMAMFSTASASKIVLQKPRVDYFDKRYLGWTCEGMDFPKLSGNPFKPDDLSDIIARDPRCGVFFAVDASKFQLTCLPAIGPNRKDKCKPVRDQNSILYIMRRTDYDGMLPPVDQIGNAGGLVAAGGIPADLMGKIDPTGFWSGGFNSDSASNYFANAFASNPSTVVDALGGGMGMGLGGGMFPPIKGFPGSEYEDVKQYNYFVQGIITRDMDPAEKQTYAAMAAMNGQTVKPVNPAYYGTDNEYVANMGYMQGIMADKKAASATGATPTSSTDDSSTTSTSTDSTSTSTDSSSTTSRDTSSTTSTDSSTATAAASSSSTTNAMDMLSFMNNPYLLLDKDVDDIPLPMNTMGGMGAMGGDLATMMAMQSMQNNLVLKAYRQGERDELAKKGRRLRRPRAGGDDIVDMMMMQQLMGGSVGTTGGGGGVGLPSACGKPVNDRATCKAALQSAALSGCMGKIPMEREDQVQYLQICTYGKCVLTGFMRNPDIDNSEVRGYAMCAQMTKNEAMKKILSPAGATASAAAAASGGATSALPNAGGVNLGMLAGMDIMDVDDAPVMAAIQNALAGQSGSTASQLPLAMMMDDDAAMMMALQQNGGASLSGLPMALLLDDGLDDGMLLPGILAPAASSTATTADSSTQTDPVPTTSRLLSKPRQYVNLAGLPYMLEDSEDYATAMGVKQYLASLPQGSSIQFPTGLIDTDMFDDLGEGGMMGGLGMLSGLGLGLSPTPATSTGTTAGSTASSACGSYTGMLPKDGIDQGQMMLPFYAPLVRDLVNCLGTWAVSDGVNSDTVAIYAAMRGFAAPAGAVPASASTTTTGTGRRLRRPRSGRYAPQRHNGYRRYQW